METKRAQGSSDYSSDQPSAGSGACSMMLQLARLDPQDPALPLAYPRIPAHDPVERKLPTQAAPARATRRDLVVAERA